VSGIADVFSPYLISFGFYDQFQGASVPQTYSGFLLELEDSWYLCSAAHNIDHCQAILSRGGEFSNWHINDMSGRQAPEKRWPYPFNFMNRPRFCLRHDAYGFDYCLIELENLAVANLKQSGTRAFGIEDIGYASAADIWFITGVPAETIKKEGGRIHQQHLALRAKPLGNRPDDWDEGKSLNAVFGQLEDSPDHARPIENIAGMSGGGVLGLYIRDDKSAVVKLVGIQSGWSKDRRIVSIAPIAPFIEIGAGRISETPHTAGWSARAQL
jgi:hypothetical protein